MKVWSVVILLLKKGMNTLPECLLVCNLVVLEWAAAIAGDCIGLFQSFSSEAKSFV
jgi:hypothetical protein